MGTEYKGENLEQLTDLGIKIVNLQAFRPDLKGTIERTFQSIQNLFKCKMKGMGVVEPDYMERTGRDYRKDSCITMDEMEKIILHCIVYYNSQLVVENFPYTDAMFEEKLRGPIYDENPEAARFVLCSIEAQHQTREIYSDLWSRDSSNKYIWTIEHIFPEGENIPQDWVDMIASGDKENAKKLRVEYVHTLGNLTVTGYNQNLSNMSFEQKRDRKSKDKSKEMGYRNGLYLNTDVVCEDVWTVDKIKARTDRMVESLLEMFAW